MKKALLSIATLALMGAPALADNHENVSGFMAPKEPAPAAVTDILDAEGQEIGHATFTQGTLGVLIEISVKNLPPGKHGMHFHEKGDCSDHGHFKAAGGHIGHEKPHGYLNPEGPHAGNLPNLIVHADGTAEVELYSDLVSVSGEKFPLLDEDGSTLVIHANPDDHTTQPIGGAGPRIACGVVVKLNY